MKNFIFCAVQKVFRICKKDKALKKGSGRGVQNVPNDIYKPPRKIAPGLLPQG